MTDQTKTPEHSPPLPLPNTTHKVEMLARIPIECGCVYEVSGSGDLPLTVEQGRIFIDPMILRAFLHEGADGLTLAYGELVMRGAACPAKLDHAAESAPSTNTPQ